MDVLTSTPVLFVAVWLATAAVLRLLYLLWQRQREGERFVAANDASHAVLIGATDVRVGTVLGAVVTLAVALLVSGVLLFPGPDRAELDRLVSAVAISYGREGVDEEPDPTVTDLLDRFEAEGGDRDDVVVRTVAPGWEEGAALGQPDDGARFQVDGADGEFSRCLEITWSEEESGYTVRAEDMGDLC